LLELDFVPLEAGPKLRGQGGRDRRAAGRVAAGGVPAG
jgi:hypothetical protein